MTVYHMARSKIKVKVTWGLKVINYSIFKINLLCHFPWQLANDCWFLNHMTISKFGQAGFLIPVLDFVSHDLIMYWTGKAQHRELGSDSSRAAKTTAGAQRTTSPITGYDCTIATRCWTSVWMLIVNSHKSPSQFSTFVFLVECGPHDNPQGGDFPVLIKFPDFSRCLRHTGDSIQMTYIKHDHYDVDWQDKFLFTSLAVHHTHVICT